MRPAWHRDLALAREAGATAIRYGFPWYRVNPAPGRFVWDWADQVVDRLEELGLEVILDLVHYGTPLWLEGAFLNPGYPEVVAEYRARVAERYRGRVTAFTPLNEPLVTIMYCGEMGRWPPYLRRHEGFVSLTRAVVRGIVLTQRAIAEATGGQATFVHVEATFRYVAAASAVAQEVELLRERCFLVEDLLTGRVDEAHTLVGYLRQYGFDDEDLAWCQEHTAPPDLLGINYYPHLTTVEFVDGHPSGPRRHRDDGAVGLEELIRTFSERYGFPIFLTETSTRGGVDERLGWLEESLRLVARLRAEGVEVVGYTWWPLFDLVDWAYREGDGPAVDYLVPMGLYDLRPSSVGVLERVKTPLVDRFRAYAEAGLDSLGESVAGASSERRERLPR